MIDPDLNVAGQIATPPEATRHGDEQPMRGEARSGTGWVARLAILGVLIALIGLFSGLEPGTFPRYSTFTAVVAANASVLLLSLGVTVTLRAGDFDLSVSAVMIVSGAIVAKCLNNGLGLGTGIVLALLFALGTGLLNAILVVVCGLDSFITTLGTMTAIVGIGYGLTQSTVVSGYGGDVLKIARTQLHGIQTQVIVGWVAALLLLYVCDWTLLGRQWAFTGGNREAAGLLGLRVRSLRVSAFCITAICSCSAGVLLAGSVGSVDPSSSGEYLLTPFAAAFLGTAAVSIGQFNILGTVIGVYILGVGQMGLALLGAPPWITNLFNGGTLVVALGFAAVLQRQRGGAILVLLRRLRPKTCV